MFYRCKWHESGTKLTLAKYFGLRLTRVSVPEPLGRRGASGALGRARSGD